MDTQFALHAQLNIMDAQGEGEIASLNLQFQTTNGFVDLLDIWNAEGTVNGKITGPGCDQLLPGATEIFVVNGELHKNLGITWESAQ